MPNIFNSSLFVRPVLGTILCAFSFSSIAPIHAFEFPIQIDVVDDALAMSRIEKLVSKIKKTKKTQDVEACMKYLFELKDELQDFGGIKISIDQCINDAQKQLKSNGIIVSKKEWKLYKSMLNKKSKKSKHQKTCTTIGLSLDQADALFSSMKSNYEDDEEIEIELPVRVSYGITITLCGIFLCCLRNPYCVNAGKYLIATGVGMLGDYYVDRKEEDYNEGRKDER